MCIIIYNETGKAYDKARLGTAYDNNPHGVGIMWVEKGKARTIRGLWSKKKLFRILEDFAGVPHAIHMRWRTRGEISESMCHPFRASAKKLPRRVYLMHNGTFANLQSTKEHSDTFMFAKSLRVATAKHGTDILFTESFLRRLEYEIDSWNKVIFLRDDGKVAIVNPNKWHVEDGFWYSNTYSLKKGYRDGRTPAPAKGKTAFKPMTWKNGKWVPTERTTIAGHAGALPLVSPSKTGNTPGIHYMNGIAYQLSDDGVWHKVSSFAPESGKPEDPSEEKKAQRLFGGKPYAKGVDGIWREISEEDFKEISRADSFLPSELKPTTPKASGVRQEADDWLTTFSRFEKKRSRKKLRKEARRRARQGQKSKSLREKNLTMRRILNMHGGSSSNMAP